MNFAIIGMEAVFSGCVGLEAFGRCIHQGIRASGQLPPELKNNPALLRRVVSGAMADAGWASAASTPARVALLSAISAGQNSTQPASHNPETTERLRLIAREVGISGPIYDLSNGSNPWIACLDKAEEILDAGEAEAAIVAAVSLNSEPFGEPKLAIRSAGSSSPFGLDQNTHGWSLGEGGAAVVVIRDTERVPNLPLEQKNLRIYARIIALGSNKNNAVRQDSREVFSENVSPQEVAQCCQRAFQAAGIHPDDIGYLEVFGSGFDPLDELETTGLLAAYGRNRNALTCALGSAQAIVGFTFAAAGLASLVRTALILYQRMIPSVPVWSGPKFKEKWEGSPFYVTPDSRTWFLEKAEATRLAAINSIGMGASCAHIILSENTRDTARSSQVLSQENLFFFPLAGEDVRELLGRLSALKTELLAPPDLQAVARRYADHYQNHTGSRIAVSILGRDSLELSREIDFALRGLPSAAEKGTEWQTPLGSYFTPAPLGSQAGIAFVYPGAFSSYAGFGRDLFYLFPQYYERLASLVYNVGSAIQEKTLYPRSLDALSKEQQDAIESRLNTDPIAMLTSGMCMAILFTLILNDTFKIRNQDSFGYSLGENSMMFAAGVMTHGWEGKKRLEESPLFRTRLAGPQNAVREYWGLPPAADGRTDQDFWGNYVLMASPEQVKDLIEGEERVFLTHINTPRQVAIAGDPKSCQRIIESLHCNALRAPFNYALHCPAIQSEYPALVELHSWPVAQKPVISLYSSADCDLFSMEREAIARKMARGLCSTVDFPRLVNRVYDDGARIYIELGAGSNCTKWVDDTLKSRPHCAMSINRRGVDDFTSILRVLGRLCSQRIPLDLSPLYKAN